MMAVANVQAEDLKRLLALRSHNGGDLWSTPDIRLGKGSPFSTLDCAIMISDLGAKRSEPIVRQTAELIFSTIGEDGRCRIAPKTGILPCHTANAVRALCWLGYAKDKRLANSFEHFLQTQEKSGGWRCNVKKRGVSAEADAANPGPTLWILDGFRFTDHLNTEKSLDRAVGFLLGHWTTRKPLGPCHFGIGSRFMQLEYPFLRYNLFYYVYALSFYESARSDKRFRDALGQLEAKQDNGKIIVESPNRKLAAFAFCKKGEHSALATKRYREIQRNIGEG